jgi:energy-coupling factor transporter ATP-binding protein EcfA2
MLPGDELHAPVAPIRDDGLIGRTRLLHTLERALSDGHTVLVFGPIGSGKTAVLHALARRARARAVPCAIAERTASLPDFTRALASAYPSLDLSGRTQRQARSRLLAAVERRPPLVLLDHLVVRGVALKAALKPLRGTGAGVLLAADVEHERDHLNVREAAAHAPRAPGPAAARPLDARAPSSPAHRAPPTPPARTGRRRRPRVRRGGFARTRRLVLRGAFTGRGVVVRPGTGRLAPLGGGHPRGRAPPGRPGHPGAFAARQHSRTGVRSTLRHGSVCGSQVAGWWSPPKPSARMNETANDSYGSALGAVGRNTEHRRLGPTARRR